MNKRLNTTAQGGFTLIELIVVIVILGILAATALPRFTAMSGDARVAALNAARGSLNSVAAMAHGRALVAGSNTANVQFENGAVAMVNGYPKAAQATFDAAGLSTNDFAFVAAGNTSSATPATSPTTTSTQIAIVPKVFENTASATGCYLLYSEATSTTAPPQIAVTGTGETCK